MGEQAGVAAFVAQDGFLRRTAHKRYIKRRDGRFVVSFEAFKPRLNEPDLSFTFQAPHLRSEQGLRQFQQHKELPHGDLPGICMLSYANLNDQSLPPRFKEDPDDTVYGKLHHVTDLPESQPQMESMAAMASHNNDHGLPFLLIEHRKRDDLKDSSRKMES